MKTQATFVSAMVLMTCLLVSAAGCQCNTEATTSVSLSADPPPASSGPGAAAAPSAYQPSTDLPPIKITARAGECPELPALPTNPTEEQQRAAALAASLRKASCDPSLYAKPLKEVVAALAPPPSVDVTFGSPRSLTFRSKDLPSAKALIDALGIDKPVVRLEWQAYHDNFFLGDNETTGTIDRFGPGAPLVAISHEADRNDPQGKITIWDDSMKLTGWISVSLPNDSVTVEPDEEGVKLAVNAIDRLAAHPDWLADEPPEVARRLGLEGERFRVARTSLHRDDVIIKGISLDPQRTLILGDALAEALGLEKARAQNINREHDVWQMSVMTETTLSYRGLSLEIEVTPKDGDDPTVDLAGSVVDFIIIRRDG